MFGQPNIRRLVCATAAGSLAVWAGLTEQTAQGRNQSCATPPRITSISVSFSDQGGWVADYKVEFDSGGLGGTAYFDDVSDPYNPSLWSFSPTDSAAYGSDYNLSGPSHAVSRKVTIKTACGQDTRSISTTWLRAKTVRFAPAAACPALYVIDNRGSGARPGLSSPGKVFTDTLKRLLPGVQVERNPYQAFGSLDDLVGSISNLRLFAAYQQSTADGEWWLASHLRRLGQTCPATNVILVGYSQGAEVVADVFQTRSLEAWPPVVAVVLFGDPKFNPADPSDQGNYSYHYHGFLGTRPVFRTGSTLVLSYCRRHDPVCQKSWLSAVELGEKWLLFGSNPLAQHDNYLGEAQKAARLIGGKD